MEGWKYKKGVLTVVPVWGWTGREAPGGPGACFCSGDCGEKMQEERSFKGLTHKHSYASQICAFVQTQLSTNRPQCHLRG